MDVVVVNLFSKRVFALGQWLTGFVLFLSGQAATQAAVDLTTLLDLSAPTDLRANSFLAGLTETLGQDGTLYMTRELRQVVDAGVDVAALNNYFMQNNQGRIHDVPLKIHSSFLPMVEFANEMLKESGLTAFRYVAETDDSLPKSDEPFVRDARSFKRWYWTRAIVAPLLGFIVTLVDSVGKVAPSAGSDTTGTSVWERLPYADKVKGLSLSIATLVTEMQFVLLSNCFWNKYVWSQKGRVIPPFSSQLNTRFGQVVNGLNSLLAHWTWGPTLNWLVNYSYSAVVYSGLLLGATIFGVHVDKSYADVLKESFWGTWLFFAAFGINQPNMASMANVGMLNFTTRFKMESLQWYLSAPGRIMGMVPALKSYGMWMQLASGAVITVPMFILRYGIRAYAQQTGRRVAAQTTPQSMRDITAVTSPAPSMCERIASGFAGSRFWNLGLVRSFLRGGTGN